MPPITLRPDFIRANPVALALGVLLAPVYGAGLLLVLWWWLVQRTTRLTIDADRVRFEEGVLAVVIAEVRIENIRAVRVEATLLQRILGVGDVVIWTAGDRPEFIARGFAHPLKIQRMIQG